MPKQNTARYSEVSDPPIARFLFTDRRFAWFWMIVRLYLGYTWLNSGWGKFTNPAWVNTGEALKSFWLGIIKTDPRPVIYFDWYRQFIQYMVDNQTWVWFAKLIVAGELLVGLALVLGAFTGIAAFFGGFLNWNFLMAGTASSNPVLFTFAVLLILAWKTAGYWGLDRYLLPLLGTPWKPGVIVSRPVASPSAAP